MISTSESLKSGNELEKQQVTKQNQAHVTKQTTLYLTVINVWRDSNLASQYTWVNESMKQVWSLIRTIKLQLFVLIWLWHTGMYRLWCRKFVFVDNCSAYSWINIEFQILFSTRKFLFGRKYPLFWWDLTCSQFNLFAKIARLIGK